MELFEALKTRRSHRRFLDKEIPDNLLKKIIEAGTWAPSDCNLQGWSFVVVRNKKIKERMVNEAGTNIRVTKSPVTIVICYDKFDPHTGIQAVSAAVQNMLLASHSLGIASCWMASCGNREKLKEILKIPEDINIASIVVLGYPRYNLKLPPPRKSVEEITHFDGYKPKKQISYSYHPEMWTADDLRKHHHYYCRKTAFGVEMDVVAEKEKELVQRVLSKINSTVFDVFSYDGTFLKYFPDQKIISVNLEDQTSIYVEEAAKNNNKEVKTVTFNDKIPLQKNSVKFATSIFKVERLPKELRVKTFKEVKKVLQRNGKFFIIFRNTPSVYSLMYRLIKMKFGDDVRNSAIYSFFGPYKPLSTEEVGRELEDLGFELDVKKYFPITPQLEIIYQLYLQYKASAGTVFLHRLKREDGMSRLIDKMLDLQGFRTSPFGSVTLIEAKKVK